MFLYIKPSYYELFIKTFSAFNVCIILASPISCSIPSFFIIIFFFLFLIGNGPHVSRALVHTLSQFPFTLFYYMFNRSRIHKKRRRRAAYGRSLYKINNDTSTKFIKRIVIIIAIIVIVVAVRSRRIIVLKKVIISIIFFSLLGRSMLVHEGKAYVTSVCDLNVFRGCWWTIFPIFYSITRFCVQVYAIRVFVNLHWYTCAFSVRRMTRTQHCRTIITSDRLVSGLLRNIHGCISYILRPIQSWKITRSQPPEQLLMVFSRH